MISAPPVVVPTFVPTSAGTVHGIYMEVPDGFRFIGPVDTLRKAQEWVFVLRSVGLEGSVRTTSEGGHGLLVLESHHQRALETLGTYEEENRDFPPRPKPDRALHPPSSWAMGIVAAMVAFFLVTGPARLNGSFFRWGTADTDQMLHGKPWEAVTALTLHADGSHVFGNALAGALFLTAVHGRLGAGVGTFAVLAAGTAGNLLNALWHVTGHRSIGASTAVFAAVGVLAASQMVLNRNAQRGFFATWGPVVGGLALLGMLGASPNSDLHAHGFGFGAGVVAGLLAAIPLRGREKPLAGSTQLVFGAASVALVVGSWLLAANRVSI
jgi:rhomboid protease GluP